MPKPQLNEPHIRFTMQGAIALCIAGGRTHFDVGIIKGAGPDGRLTNHDLTIEVWALGNGAPNRLASYTHSDLANEVRLELHHSAAPQSPVTGIELFGANTVDRFSDQMANDFAWVLDMENHEMHGDQVTINPKALRSVLRVENIRQASFYSGYRSLELLEVADQIRQWTFGRVAALVEALVVLPPGGATITNGQAAVPLAYDADINYEIIVTHLCPLGACVGDRLADIYDPLYDSNRPDGKISLVDTIVLSENSPEVLSRGADEAAAKALLAALDTDILTGCPSANFSRSLRLPTPQ